MHTPASFSLSTFFNVFEYSIQSRYKSCMPIQVCESKQVNTYNVSIRLWSWFVNIKRVTALDWQPLTLPHIYCLSSYDMHWIAILAISATACSHSVWSQLQLPILFIREKIPERLPTISINMKCCAWFLAAHLLCWLKRNNCTVNSLIAYAINAINHQSLYARITGDW